MTKDVPTPTMSFLAFLQHREGHVIHFGVPSDQARLTHAGYPQPLALIGQTANIECVLTASVAPLGASERSVQSGSTYPSPGALEAASSSIQISITL